MTLFGIDFTAAELVLGILLLILLLYSVLIYRRMGQRVKETAKPSAKPDAEGVSATGMVQEDNEEELVAVLTAAAAVMMETNVGNIRLASYKQIEPQGGTRSTWGRAGKLEQVTRF